MAGPNDAAVEKVHTKLVASALPGRDRKSTRLNSSHPSISYAVFCLKKKIHSQRDERKRSATSTITPYSYPDTGCTPLLRILSAVLHRTRAPVYLTAVQLAEPSTAEV